jgi:hypothetical protein
METYPPNKSGGSNREVSATWNYHPGWELQHGGGLYLYNAVTDIVIGVMAVLKTMISPTASSLAGTRWATTRSPISRAGDILPEPIPLIKNPRCGPIFVNPVITIRKIITPQDDEFSFFCSFCYILIGGRVKKVSFFYNVLSTNPPRTSQGL